AGRRLPPGFLAREVIPIHVLRRSAQTSGVPHAVSHLALPDESTDDESWRHGADLARGEARSSGQGQARQAYARRSTAGRTARGPCRALTRPSMALLSPDFETGNYSRLAGAAPVGPKVDLRRLFNASLDD